MQTFIPPPQATKKILIENATAKQVLFKPIFINSHIYQVSFSSSF